MRRALIALVASGLLGCSKSDQKPQKRTPRPEGGDDPVFAVDLPRLPVVSRETSLLRRPAQPAEKVPA
jgi:hypothetical protein